MITCQTYTILKEGKESVLLTLPCFCGIGENQGAGWKEDFYAASRMNRFYSHAAAVLYRYALSFYQEGLRRMTFLCRSEVQMEESGIITVFLHLSLRRILEQESCPTLRKSMVHRWKNGALLRK